VKGKKNIIASAEERSLKKRGGKVKADEGGTYWKQREKKKGGWSP